MKKSNSIMVAADISECAMMAGKRAAMLCRQLEKEQLDIINVQDVSVIDMLASMLKSSSDDARKIVKDGVSNDLTQAVSQLESQYHIHCELIVRFGKAFPEILQEITERMPELLVIGAHSAPPKSKNFLGNLPSKLLQASPVPLLVIRNEPKQAYKKIIIAIDFSDISHYQAMQALRLAGPDTEVIFVHAYEVPNDDKIRYANVSQDLLREFRSTTRIKTGAKMQMFIAGLKTSLPITSVIQMGEPHDAIMQLWKKEKPDLLVMGKQGRSRFAEFMLGSTSRHVIYETDCDILLVPPSAMPAMKNN